MIELGRYKKYQGKNDCVKSSSQGKWKMNTILPICVKPTATEERIFTHHSQKQINHYHSQAQLADIMKSTEHGIILSLSKYIFFHKIFFIVVKHLF